MNKPRPLSDIDITFTIDNCPVQAEGRIGDHLCEFRARGRLWSLEIWRSDEHKIGDSWIYREKWPGGEYDAGWMTKDEARQCIGKAVRVFEVVRWGDILRQTLTRKKPDSTDWAALDAMIRDEIGHAMGQTK